MFFLRNAKISPSLRTAERLSLKLEDFDDNKRAFDLVRVRSLSVLVTPFILLPFFSRTSVYRVVVDFVRSTVISRRPPNTDAPKGR